MNDIRRKSQILLFMFSCVCLSFSNIEPNDSILSCTHDLTIFGSIKQCGGTIKITYWESPTRNSCNITLTCITKDYIEIPRDAFNHLRPLTDFNTLNITIENCNINEEFITQVKRALKSLPSWHDIKDFEINLIANDQNTSLLLQNKSLLNFCPCHFYGISYFSIFGLQTGVIPDCVERLSITDCDLQTLPQDTFSSNGKLIQLQMEHNQLINLPDYIFQNLTNLEKLSLARNQLSVLSSNLFTGLHNLSELILSDNNITTLPPDVFKPLVNLTSLQLDNNPIVTIIESSFTPLHKLTNLTLSFCGLIFFNTTMPIDRFVMLDISNNNISGLKHLNLHHPSNELYLSNNNISLINNFSHHVNTSPLEILHMRNCGIKHISDKFLQDATQLISLDLTANEIRDLPERFLENSKFLEELLLDCNKLANVSDALFRDKQLRTLSLSGNRLTEIGAGMLQGQTSLVHLNLSHNQISEVHREAFRDTTLIELDISYNMLTNNDEDIFGRKGFSLDIDWSRIRKLYLSYNNISMFRTRAYYLQSGLEELSLNNNELIDWYSTSMHNLLSLNLANNTFHQAILYSFLVFTPHLQNINLSNGRWQTIHNFLKVLKYLQMIDLSLNEIEILSAKDFLYSSKKLYIDVSNNDVATIVLEDKEVKEEIEYQDRCSDVQLKITASSMNCDCYIINVLRFYENDITLRHSLDVFVANISESHITCERPTALQDGSFEDVESSSLELLSLFGLCLL